MKILFGEETLEDGKIYLDHTKKITISSPIKAIEMGIGMVHQHFYVGSLSDCGGKHGAGYGAH